MTQLPRSLCPGVLPLLQRYATRAVVVSLLGCSAACGSLQAQPPSPSSPTPSISPSTAIVATGRLEPEGGVIKISVTNAQDSRVNQILVRPGDWVKANQVIAILQGQDKARQLLRDAEANVAIKRAQRQKIQQGDSKDAEIAAQQAAIVELEARLRTETIQKQTEIAEAEANLRNAELSYQRNQTLANQGAVRQSDFDDAQEAFETAQATLARRNAELENTIATLQAQRDQAQANLAKLREVRPVDVQIAQAELEQAQIQVEQRRAELDDTLVRVPVAGQILRINTRVGEQVNTQEGIAELGRTKQMYAIAEVYETDIARVRTGQSATLTSEYGGFQGEIRGNVEQTGLQIGKTRLNQEASDPKTDVNARVVEVMIRIDPNDSPKVAAMTGMQVRVKIATAAQ